METYAEIHCLERISKRIFANRGL